MPRRIEILNESGFAPDGRLAPEIPEQNGFSFVTVFHALRRRKWVILATMMLVNTAVCSVLYFIPPHYTATALLAMEPAGTHVLAGKPVARGLPEWMPGDNSVMMTQVNILKAPALAAQVVDSLGLKSDPEFSSLSGNIRAQVDAAAQHWFPVRWQELIPWNVDFDWQPQSKEIAVQHLLRELSVQQQGTSHVISVSFTSTDWVKAARVANAIVDNYLKDQMQAKYQITDQVYRWVATQVRMQKAELIRAETTAVDYMAANGLVATNGLPQPSQAPPDKTTYGGLAGQQLTSLQGDLANARSELASKEAKLNELEDLKARGAGYDSLPEVAASPVILELQKQDAVLRRQEAQLASTYSAQTPVLLRIKAERVTIALRIASETQIIVQGIRDEANLARDRVKQLESMLLRGRDQYTQSERASVELRELNRAATAKRTTYETLLARMNELREQLALVKPDANVVSAAMPSHHFSSPNKLALGAIGFIGSIALGVTLAGLVEYSDKSLRTGQQVEQVLGFGNLGLVPLLKRRGQSRGQKLHKYIFHHPQSVYAEAIRSILVQFLSGTRAQVVLITSALPGEGKTTMTLSLAAVAARLGRKTVVVDVDLRRPTVAHEAGLSIRAGLAEFMAGEASLAEIIYTEPDEPRLHIIPLRKPLKGSADLLHSWDMEGLIKNLSVYYEYVFLDLPPSLAISDIQPFGLLAYRALFVVQWGKTSRSAAMSGLATLSRIGVSIAGVTLTQVDLARHALYGYEQFGEYHQKYLEYFRQ